MKNWGEINRRSTAKSCPFFVVVVGRDVDGLIEGGYVMKNEPLLSQQDLMS